MFARKPLISVSVARAQGSEQEIGEVAPDHDFGALELGYVSSLTP